MRQTQSSYFQNFLSIHGLAASNASANIKPDVPIGFSTQPERAELEKHLLGFAQFLNLQAIHARHAERFLDTQQINQESYQLLANRLWKTHFPPEGSHDQSTAVFYEPFLMVLRKIQQQIQNPKSLISAADKTNVLRELAKCCMWQPKKAIFHALNAYQALQEEPQPLQARITEERSVLNNLLCEYHIDERFSSSKHKVNARETSENYNALKSALPSLNLKEIFKSNNKIPDYAKDEIHDILAWLDEEISPVAFEVSTNLGWISLKIAQKFHRRAYQLIRNRQQLDVHWFENIVIALKKEFGSEARSWWPALGGHMDAAGLFCISSNPTLLAQSIINTMHSQLPSNLWQRAAKSSLNTGYPRCDLVKLGPLRWLETQESWNKQVACAPLQLSTLKQYCYDDINLSPREWLELISNSSVLDVDEYLDDVRNGVYTSAIDGSSSLQRCLPSTWLAVPAIDLIDKCRDLDLIQTDIVKPATIDKRKADRELFVELAQTLALAEGLPWWQ